MNERLCTSLRREVVEGLRTASEPTRIMPNEAKRLAIAAGAIDVAWAASFLVHCHDRADAEGSLAALRANCPERFKKPRAIRVNGRGVALPAPRISQARGRDRKQERAPYGR